MSKVRPPNPETIARMKRRAEQTIDGAQAMREYIKTTEAARNRLVQLRAERLARAARETN